MGVPSDVEDILDTPPLPQLVVFDLDYTLWPLWVDTHLSGPPFTLHDGVVRDRAGRTIELYPVVRHVLKGLKARGVLIGLASRTHEPEWAKQIVHLLRVDESGNTLAQMADCHEIYPGSKVEHFRRLRESTGIPYEAMAFFDDEGRNIAEVGRLGVACTCTPSGLTADGLRDGLEEFRRRQWHRQ